MNLRTIANDMALVAQQNPHDFLERLIVPEACGRKIAYGDQMVDFIFSLDVFKDIGKSTWHLSITPEQRDFTEVEITDILFAFFGDGPVEEMTENIRESFAIPKLQRRYYKMIE